MDIEKTIQEVDIQVAMLSLAMEQTVDEETQDHIAQAYGYAKAYAKSLKRIKTLKTYHVFQQEEG